VILLAGLVAVIVSVPLLGGRLTRIPELRLRWPHLVASALAVQILVITILPAVLPNVIAEGLHLATYGAAAAFVYVNRRIAGLSLVTLGGGANLAAVIANAGRMPASAQALRIAGLRPSDHFTNSGFVPHAHLAWLGDIFAIPRSWPLANVFSVGDVLLLAGAFALLHLAGQSRLSGARRNDSLAAALA
jgi:hypothetical protein